MKTRSGTDSFVRYLELSLSCFVFSFSNHFSSMLYFSFSSQLLWARHLNLILYCVYFAECLSRLQYCVELGQQTGRYTRTRDIVAWARKRHRTIRRDDLLAFLCGKTTKSRSGETSKSRSGGPSGRPPRHSISTLRHSHSLASADGVAGDLGPFHHALALQGTYTDLFACFLLFLFVCRCTEGLYQREPPKVIFLSFLFICCLPRAQGQL